VNVPIDTGLGHEVQIVADMGTTEIAFEDLGLILEVLDTGLRIRHVVTACMT
jgi:hypothetical protein